MNVTKLYTVLSLFIVSCGAPPPKLDSKARLSASILPKLNEEVARAQEQLDDAKEELTFIEATLKQLEGAAACTQENAALGAKELEEKCKLQYSFDLKERRHLLLARAEAAKEKLSAAQAATPSAQALASGGRSQCQTCHLLIAAPGFPLLQEAPELSSHPRFDALMATHDPKIFGCQSCHQGNESFKTEAAHNQMLWEPIAINGSHVWQDKVTPGASPSDWAQSSCSSCHSQEMSHFVEVACSSDSDCSPYGEGYVCGTFLQRAALSLERVPAAVALAKSRGEDAEAAADAIMRPFTEDPRAGNSSIDNAKFAALDAVSAALDEKKSTLEASWAGRRAASELFALVIQHEPPEAKTSREEARQALATKLAQKVGDGGELFASLSFGAPTPLRCVEEKTDLPRVDAAPLLTKGKMILREAGCVGCHAIPGAEELPKQGPALDRLSQKTNLAWLSQWIANPKEFRPNTRMPNFFPEAIEPRALKEASGRDGKPLGRYYGFDGAVKPPREYAAEYEASVYQLHTDALQLREQESSAIASYLMSASKNDLKLEEISGDAARGETLFSVRGCLGCHQAQPRPAFDPAQEIPSAEERCDVKLGQDCNPTKPYQNAYSHFDVAPNLSNIGDKTNIGWLYLWLKDPKSLQPDSRMPSLRLSDEDARDIAAYLMTLRGAPASSSPVEAKPRAGDPSGKELIEKYGCFQCHVIPGFEERKKVAPDLSSFGDKRALNFGDVFVGAERTWEAWTEQKLLYPRSLDVKATMPYSQLRPDEVYAVLIALRGLRQETKLSKEYTPEESAIHQGRFLLARYNCWGCHKIDGREGAVLSYFDTQETLGSDRETRRSFGPPSLQGEGARVKPDWFVGFLQKVIELRPWIEKTITIEEGRTAGIRMPSFEMPAPDAEALAAYFAAMSGAPMTAKRQANELTYEQALEGRALFKQAACESCHPYEGVGQAPNLNLALRRLQGDWILRWMISPLRTPPGTSRMPHFFGDPDDTTRGRFNSPLTDFFEGDAISQMIRIRDYVMVISECPPDESFSCRVGTGTTLPTSAPTSVPQGDK